MEQDLRIFPLIGAVLGLFAVAAGAFGAHALKERLGPAELDSFMTGARYQLIHAALLLIPAVSASRFAGWCFTIGILFFSGSIYLLTLGGASWAWPFTPMGGVLLMLGWGALVVQFIPRAPKA